MIAVLKRNYYKALPPLLPKAESSYDGIYLWPKSGFKLT